MDVVVHLLDTPMPFLNQAMGGGGHLYEPLGLHAFLHSLCVDMENKNK